MNENLNKARSLLATGSYTCVLCRENISLTDDRNGIRPLLELYRSGTDLRGFSAADKVVGKAAAFLYLLMGVEALYAPVISAPALQLLAEGGIDVHYGHIVSAIQNRSRSGLCPMETAVWDIADPAQALLVIEKTLAAI